LAHSPL